MVGSPFLPTSYIYMNAFILAFGFWAIVNPESTDAILMVNLISYITVCSLLYRLFVAIEDTFYFPLVNKHNPYAIFIHTEIGICTEIFTR